MLCVRVSSWNGHLSPGAAVFISFFRGPFSDETCGKRGDDPLDSIVWMGKLASVPADTDESMTVLEGSRALERA